MRKLALLSVVGLVCLTSMAGIASATLITFDDLTPAPNNYGFYSPIPDGYAGLHWDPNFWVMESTTYQDNPSGYLNGMVSPDNVAFNAYVAGVYVDPDVTFDFNGAYLSAAWNDNLNITVEGWLGGNLLYSNTVVAQCTGPQWFEFDYLGIDHLTFASWGGTNHGYSMTGEHFVMDNMVVNGGVVPEPAALMSLLSGLALLGGYRLRRK